MSNTLNGVKGNLNCVENKSTLNIYQHGAIRRLPGMYFLEHNNGTPFFYTACTAWNGTLKSTDEEWNDYLNHRAKNNYNVIQFVTTQWRGGDKDRFGQVAFEGAGIIRINTDFFKHLDKKVDEINQHGLVAAPVLLWALGSRQGRDLSPGYYLPEEEAVILARYMVARYGGNHVIWILGGDGKYTGEYEQRWKNIGRAVFGDPHPGVVALHPGGGSWIGEAYSSESWLDIVGYQSGHNNADRTLSWINRGPVATTWHKLPAKPLINMEPVYEEIAPNITAADVRSASYRSVFSAPVSGITYGANGVWPWLREGEFILNHAGKGENASRWREGIRLPGSLQIGYLSGFMQTLEWWKLKPDSSLLVEQPGDISIKNFISVLQSDDRKTIVAYVPAAMKLKLRHPGWAAYSALWFNPVTNKTTAAKVASVAGVFVAEPPAADVDHVFVLKAS
jgi:hypothetical protein